MRIPGRLAQSAFICVCLVGFAGLALPAAGQTTGSNEWAWMGGSSTAGVTIDGNAGRAGVYGTLGVASAGNIPGGREYGVTWTDKSGHFWLFGGSGSDAFGIQSYLNDLWEFLPATNQWVWVSGSSTVTIPAALTRGRSGVYGTLGVAAAGNVPGAREYAMSWTDSGGNLWLFGGFGFDADGNLGDLNDLWEFNPSTALWMWMGGSSVAAGQAGTYGTLGVAAAGNSPGVRKSSVTWTDAAGHFWLFGGSGVNPKGGDWSLNDLWEFNPALNEWAWMGGSSTVNCGANGCGQPGVYGTLGKSAAANTPGSRQWACGWTDGNGRFWLFGGDGSDASGNQGVLNDLWVFNQTTNQWAWMGGSSTVTLTTLGAPGVYGTLGGPAPGNYPGGRYFATTWTDSSGDLWLFGGNGSDASGAPGDLNDLWEFNPATNEWAWMGGNEQVPSTAFGWPGVYGSLDVAAQGNQPGGRFSGLSWTDGGGHLWLFGGNGFDQAGSIGDLNDLWEYSPPGILQQAIAPVFSPPAGVLAAGETVTIEDATPGAAIYYTVDGSTPTSSSSQYSNGLTINQTTTVTALAVVAGQTNSAASTATYTVAARAEAPVISPKGGAYTFGQSITITDSSPEATIYYSTDGSTPTPNSPVYSTPLFLTEGATVEAMAGAPGDANSNVASATYTMMAATLQANEWAWTGGSTTPNCGDRPLCGPAGIYGTLDLTSPANTPGGRFESASWPDANGHVWIFGGGGIDAYGINGALNDLWEFDPASNVWTWKGGSGAVPCYVSPCYSAGFAGTYGTLGTADAPNFPGARSSAATWSDKKGNLWLFGGNGYDSVGQVGFLNDLWKFDPAANEWTWVSGSSTEAYIGEAAYGQPGVYGTLGTPAVGNVPGARYGASTWTDSSGDLWLFGGQGYDGTDWNQGTLNDLWEFNPATNLWAWMGGGKQLQACTSTIGNCGLPGVYGSLGVPATGNAPGSREWAATWTDGKGNFWLFGGTGYDSTGNTGDLNDLWKFNPTTGQWTWMGGSNLAPCNNYSASSGLFGGYWCGNLGVYGTLGVPGAGNIPSGTPGASTWVDASGNFWLFGGKGLDATGAFVGRTNALWEFNPSTSAWAWMGGSTKTANCVELLGYGLVVCGGPTGVYGTEEVASSGNMPGSRLNSVSWVDRSGNFRLFAGQETNPDGKLADQNDVWEFQPSAGALPPAVTPTIYVAGEFSSEPGEVQLDPSSGTFAIGTPITLSNGMANASFYYTTDGSTPTTASTLYTGPISLSVSETVRAIAVAPGYANSGVASGALVAEARAATPTFSPLPGTYTSAQTVTIADATPGATILYTTDGVTTLQYQGPIPVSSTETIQAIASATGYIDSAVGAATYTINLPPQSAATPAFSVPAGTYTSAQSVTLSDSTNGSTIYYTTNGTTPTSSSTEYSGPIAIASTETLEAIATASGYATSAVASATYTINLPPPGFTVAAAPSSFTVKGGSSGTTTITVSPAGGFDSAVSFACSGLPAGATCSFLPATVTPPGTTSTVLTVTTASASAALHRRGMPVWPETAVAIALCWLGWRKRRNWPLLALLAVSLAGVGLVNGCGSGGSNSGGGGGGGGGGGSQPVTSTVTVTATSGTLQPSTTFSLTVD